MKLSKEQKQKRKEAKYRYRDRKRLLRIKEYQKKQNNILDQIK